MSDKVLRTFECEVEALGLENHSSETSCGFTFKEQANTNVWALVMDGENPDRPFQILVDGGEVSLLMDDEQGQLLTLSIAWIASALGRFETYLNSSAAEAAAGGK